MAVGGKKREGFGLDVGFIELEVQAFSPTREELIELLEIPEENQENFKEKTYTGEKDGVKTTRVDVWFKGVKNNKFYSKGFYLEKKNRVNKLGTLNQYINSKGMVTWADSEDNLPTWFLKNAEARQALVGEEQLYSFLRNYLTELDFRDETTTLSLDTKALFAGNFSELKELIGSGYEGIIVGLAEVKTSDKDGEVKQYQNLNDNFLPGYMMKQIKISEYTPESVEKLREKHGKLNDEGKKVYLKGVDAYIVGITDPEHGSKNEFVLKPVEAYDPEKSFVASKEVIQHDPENSDY